MAPERAAPLVYDWNRHAGGVPAPTGPVSIHDETLRDGLQSPSVRVPALEEKLALMRLAARLGVASVDVGFPAASERATRDAEALVRAVAAEGLVPVAAGRTAERDVEAIAGLARRTGVRVEAALFVGSSPIRMYAEGWELELLLRRTERAVRTAVEAGLDVLFVTEDSTRSRPEHLEALYATAIGAGARRICLSDTVGHATPRGAAAITGWARDLVARLAPGVGIDWHGHNDRGLATACALAAAAAGADRIHATAFGIGERVGNVPMEQLLVNLELEGWWQGALEHLTAYCRLAASVLGVRVPPWAPVVGSDAFQTATGVHAAAVLKALERGEEWLADTVYSAVPASLVGRRQRILVGPMSGESNVRAWLRQRGLPEDERLVRAVLEAAKARERPLSDRELECLARELLGRG